MSTSLVNKERFIPSRLSNLAVWLDAKDSATIGLSGNTTQVLTWNDKSSYSNHFSVEPVPPPIPTKDIVNKLISGNYTYITSKDFSSVVTINLSGAGGGGGSIGVGGAGGFAGYTFGDIPPNTTISYTVGAAGTPGDGTGGGGGATTMTIGDNTIIAGGGGSSVKVSAGIPATQPFGGAISSDGSAGFVYNTTGITAPPPAGFVYTVGGAGRETNGSITIAPSPSNYLAGSGIFDVCAAINNAKITIKGGGGGGNTSGRGGKVVYTGNLPQGTYSWYVGNRGNGQLGGSGYKPGINGIIVNQATQPFGGSDVNSAEAGLVFTNGSTTRTAAGLTVVAGGGSALGTDGRVSIQLPDSTTNSYISGYTSWTSPNYLSTLTIELTGGGGGGGSSGTDSGGNGGGEGGRGILTLTGVPPGTSFLYSVGGGGEGSKAVGPISDDSITYGNGGSFYGSNGVGNGAGGGGVSMVSYYDPQLGFTVSIIAGGGGGGGGWGYYAGGAGVVTGGPGGRGGQGQNAKVGGKGGDIVDNFPGRGENGSIDWDDTAINRAWGPRVEDIGGAYNGGLPGNPNTGTNSGGNGGKGRITFAATPLGNTAEYRTPGQSVFIPTETSTYIISVYGAGGSGGDAGRGKYIANLTKNISYPLTVGAKGTAGSGGGASTFGNLTVGTNTGVILRGGGGTSSGRTGNGGGGSSALVFPNGYVIGAGGAAGGADDSGDGTNAGRGGGSDNNGTNAGIYAGDYGVGFAIGSSPPSSSVSIYGSGDTEGIITIEYVPIDINTTGPGSFITQVSGGYTITVNGTGVEGRGGKGEYSTPPIPSGRNLTYYVGSAAGSAFPGGPTYISPFALAGGNATLRAGGGGSYTGQQVEGASGGGGIYGGLGGNPLVAGNGFPGTGGSAAFPSVTAVLGGGAAQGATGSIYFTVLCTTPVSSPSLTTYTNPGVLFPSGYMAVSSNLPGLGSAKTLMAVYQCSGAGASMNIGLGTNVSGSSFGLCQTDGKLYSPYQYGNGYDLTFTPANYTARSYAFASYGKAPYTITGLSGFDDTQMQVSAFENLTVDSSLILGRQLAGYPSGDFILYELIATSNALSASDRQEVEAYLALKWGLTLPAGHPYRNFQPSGDQWILTTLPTTVSGLALWLDTADSGTITLNGTGRVTFWSDKSGNGCNATAGGSSLPSFSPMGGILFNGTNNYFQTNLRVNSTTHTLIAIHKPNSVAKNTSLFRFQASPLSSNYIVFPFQSSQPRGYINSGGSGILFNNSRLVDNSVPGVPNLIIADISPVGQQVYLNGTIQPSASSPIVSFTSDQLSIGSFYSGSSEFYEGTLYELIVYNQYFEQAERQLLEGYLAWKWDIVNKLPSSHPYAKESPIGATVSETLALNIPGQIPSLVTWLDAADPGTFIVSSGPTVTWYDKSATSDVFTKGTYTVPTYTNTPGGTGSSLPGVYFSGLSSLVGKATANIASGTGSCFLVATVVGSVQVLMGGYQNGNPENGNSFGFYSQGGKVYCPIQGAQNQYINSLGNLQPGSLTVFFAQMDSGNMAGQGSFQFSTPANQGTGGIYWQPSVPFPSPWNLGTTVASGGNPALGQAFYLHEFLCFSEYFNDNQRQLIEGYLAWKWGVQSQLPRTHPYSGGRPQSA